MRYINPRFTYLLTGLYFLLVGRLSETSLELYLATLEL